MPCSDSDSESESESEDEPDIEGVAVRIDSGNDGDRPERTEPVDDTV